jgi:hypothetical protein
MASKPTASMEMKAAASGKHGARRVRWAMKPGAWRDVVEVAESGNGRARCSCLILFESSRTACTMGTCVSASKHMHINDVAPSCAARSAARLLKKKWEAYVVHTVIPNHAVVLDRDLVELATRGLQRISAVRSTRRFERYTAVLSESFELGVHSGCGGSVRERVVQAVKHDERNLHVFPGPCATATVASEDPHRGCACARAARRPAAERRRACARPTCRGWRH